MITVLLRPWRQTETWWTLAHAMLDPLMGALMFVAVFPLLVTAIVLLVVFPLAIPVVWLLFAVTTLLGRLERSRLAALLGLELANPHLPLGNMSWWSKLKQRTGSASHWREITYLVVLLPISALTFGLTFVTWGWSIALLALPIYIRTFPMHSATIHGFTISSGPRVALVAVVGLAGVAFVAPWLTLGIGAVERAVARRLLGPGNNQRLARRLRQLEASRAAAVESAEAERRRIERDLHDGAQQRLVSVAMNLGRATERFDADPDAARELVVEAHREAKAALTDLRQLVRGIHPAILADRGLDAALSAVVASSPVPVALLVEVLERPPAPIESTAYFVVAEALTNVAKHAGATKARVSIARAGNRLVVEVMDNGLGGADPERGTGLRGLADRIAAVGGWMRLLSPPGGPTTLMVELPCAS
jgi:signal transduction histidine kinase